MYFKAAYLGEELFGCLWNHSVYVCRNMVYNMGDGTADGGHMLKCSTDHMLQFSIDHTQHAPIFH